MVAVGAAAVAYPQPTPGARVLLVLSAIELFAVYATVVVRIERRAVATTANRPPEERTRRAVGS
jgi:hypothetical protein